MTTELKLVAYISREGDMTQGDVETVVSEIQRLLNDIDYGIIWTGELVYVDEGESE